MVRGTGRVHGTQARTETAHAGGSGLERPRLGGIGLRGSVNAVWRTPADTADHEIFEGVHQLRLFPDDEDGGHNEHAAGVPEGYASSTRGMTASRPTERAHVVRLGPGPASPRPVDSTLPPMRCDTSP
jgi:hypothetical protein